MSAVPFSEVIATVESTIKNASLQDKQIWRQWIGLLCLPDLGISEEDVKVIRLYPNNFTVPKPADIKAVIEFALYNSNGAQLAHKFRSGSQRIYRDTRVPITAVVQPADQTLTRLIPVDVSDDPYSFNLGTNGDQVASMLLRYYVYPTDDSGFPLIRQEEVLAVVYFIRFMWSLREQEAQSAIDSNEIRWKIESDRVRSKKKMYSISPEKMKFIIRTVWNRAIPDLQFDKF